MSAYVSIVINCLTLAVSVAIIVYKSGATEARLDSRLQTLEARMSTIPNVPAEFVSRSQCEQQLKEFCRKFDDIKRDIDRTKGELLIAMSRMDDKREDARNDMSSMSNRLAEISAILAEMRRDK